MCWRSPGRAGAAHPSAKAWVGLVAACCVLLGWRIVSAELGHNNKCKEEGGRKSGDRRRIRRRKRILGEEGAGASPSLQGKLEVIIRMGLMKGDKG